MKGGNMNKYIYVSDIVFLIVISSVGFASFKFLGLL